MSDTVLKIIPVDSLFIPHDDAQRLAVQLLESFLPEGGVCEATVFPRLEFIDQGENLSTIFCPACKAAMAVYPDLAQWWHAVSDAAEEKDYEGFVIQMPCCKQTVLFSDLTFESPAGFALFQLSADDPQISGPLQSEDVRILSNALGCELRQVWARY